MMEELKLTDEEINELIERYESDLRKLRFHISNTEESISMLKKALKSNAKSALKAEIQTKKKNKIKTAKGDKQTTASAEPTTETAGYAQEAAPALETILDNVATETQIADSLLEDVMDTPADTGTSTRERRKRITVVLPKLSEQSMQAQMAAKRGPGRPRKDAAQTAPEPEKVKESGKKSKEASIPSIEKPDADASKGGYKLSEFDEMIMEALRAKNHVLINADFIEYITDKLIAAGKPEEHDEIKKKVSRSLHKLTAKRNDLTQVEHSGRGLAYAYPEWVKNGRTKPQFRRKRL